MDQPEIRSGSIVWRFRFGWLLFILGLIFPIFIPLVLMIDIPTKWKVAVSGVMAVGIPELLWIAAAATLGKEGFKIIRDKFFALFKKYGPSRKVSKTRFYVGLMMFCLPILFAWIDPYILKIFEGDIPYHLALVILGDVLFITSFFVLGGEFWHKLRSLFIHSKNVTDDLELET